MAAEYNSTAVAELLIKSGADVHAKDKVRITFNSASYAFC